MQHFTQNWILVFSDKYSHNNDVSDDDKKEVDEGQNNKIISVVETVEKNKELMIDNNNDN